MSLRIHPSLDAILERIRAGGDHPGLLVATRPHLAALFVLAAAGSLIATGIWALLDNQVAAGLFYFPNNEADAVLHFGTSAIFLAGGAHYYLHTRRQTP